MLSKNFTEWALALNPMERVLVAAVAAAPKRNESLKEFFLNRSTL